MAEPEPIEDVLQRLADEVPQEEWDALPADLLDNLDHYLYGGPKMTEPQPASIEDQIRATLLEYRTECVEYEDGPGPTDAAIKACVGLAWLCEIGPIWAVFGETEGGALLVLTSDDRNHRVTFRIDANDCGVTIMRIGPAGEIEVTFISEGGRDELLAAARWVRGEGMKNLSSSIP